MSLVIHPPTVLLVDHEEAEREALGLLLAQQGCKVYTAPSGLKGVSLFVQRSRQIDMVITARTMPRMSGLHLAQLVRRYVPTVRVALTTVPGESTTLAECESAGICAVLPKPCLEEDLLVALAGAAEFALAAR